ETGTISLYSMKERINEFTLPRSGRHVWGIDISSKGQYLVAPSDDLEVDVYDLKALKSDRKFGPGASTKSAVFTPDEKNLITGDRSGTIMVWDIQTQIPVELMGLGTIHALAVRPDSKQFASAGSGGLVNLWKLPATRDSKPKSLAEHAGPVYGLAYSPDAEHPRLASAGWD